MKGGGELLSGLDIISKLDIRVRFGSKQFRVGRCELEMMTFNEKHHWVFHLVPTAFDYAKLDAYLGKLQKSQMEALQVQGDIGDHLEVRKVAKTKNRWLQSKIENPKRSFRTWGFNSKYFCAKGECAFRKRWGQIRSWEN